MCSASSDVSFGCLEELALPVRYYIDSKSLPSRTRTLPQPRRLIFQVEGSAGLARCFFKARNATISIPELADEASPLPWGWTIAGQDRFRDLHCSIADLVANAALNLETGVPVWMRDHPQIKAKIRAIRNLLDTGCRFTLVIHEASSWKTVGAGCPEAEAETLEAHGGESRFEPGFGCLREVFGDPGVTPEGLPSLTLDGVASFIRSGACRSVVLLTGAGISTASGIPDYRGSAGLTKTLDPAMLTATEAQRARMALDPEWVASIELFRENPLPSLELKRGFVAGLSSQLWRPTLAHFFVRLLHQYGLLAKVVTQNIDGLHQAAGVPDEFVAEVHGTLREATCTSCGNHIGLEEFSRALQVHIKDVAGIDPSAPAESTLGGIPCPFGCLHGCVRPDVVFFGEEVSSSLQGVFEQDLPSADLLLIVGTSMCVAPVGKAPAHTRPSCVRMVVNNCRVGECAGLVFDEPAARRDVMAEGDIDSVLLQLASKLGWRDDLSSYREQMAEASAMLL